ncbi:NAD-dependent epimerase/dehydratase family protein [Chryseobacterium sp. RRHN12]|uniref:NAD-dependent epimerase/dehydratase family protein n=1 Tax=Chryseobacterium sp. RRHN12 TaxID=3437884 RepID=UPI003D9B1B2F
MVLVTGATGILGRVILLELLKNGRKVRACKRKSSDLEEVKRSLNYYTGNAEILFDKVEWVDICLHDQKSLQLALQGVEEVYHCAAKVSYDPHDREMVNCVNVEGTQNLLECCKNSGISKFLYVSSAVIFKKERIDKPVDEHSPLINGTNNTIYAVSKYKADAAVCKAFYEGLNTIIINPGMIIGSGNWNKSSGKFLQTFIRSFYTFSGQTGCVDVRDVASIAIALMDKNVFGERFLIASENINYKELSDIIAGKLHTIKPFVLPKIFLNMGKFLNILSGGLVPKLRMLTTPNIEFLTSSQNISNNKVAALLKYHFIPVRESLLFHIDNFLSEKK